MKTRVLIMVILVSVMFSGCAFLGKGATWLTDQHISNVNAAQEIAVRICEVSDFQTGFIRKALGSNLSSLPQEAVSTLDEIDTMILTCDCKALTGKQKGELLGLWTLFVRLGTLKIIGQFAPDVLDIIGVVL